MTCPSKEPNEKVMNLLAKLNTRDLLTYAREKHISIDSRELILVLCKRLEILYEKT